MISESFKKNILDPLFNSLGATGEWLLPYQVFARLDARRQSQQASEKFEQQTGEGRRLAAPNAVLKDIYKNNRCFILCNGPTVQKQNLLPLAGEFVISVSNGYHHPDFQKFKPRYHCVPQVTYARLTEDDVVRWFTEMHENLGDAELFLSTTEEPIVRKHGLFPGRVVRYIYLYDAFSDRSDNVIPDLANFVPRVQSVSIIALMIALYFGFDRIYLLGAEHDHFKTGMYTYFYNPTMLKGMDISTKENGQTRTTRYDDFRELGRLWQQYRAIREIAENNGVQIWNATAGGELDEFPRAKLDEVVDQPREPVSIHTVEDK